MPFLGDMLVPWRVFFSPLLLPDPDFGFMDPMWRVTFLHIFSSGLVGSPTTSYRQCLGMVSSPDLFRGWACLSDMFDQPGGFQKVTNGITWWFFSCFFQRLVMKIDSKGLRCSCCFLDGLLPKYHQWRMAWGYKWHEWSNSLGPTARVLNQSFYSDTVRELVRHEEYLYTIDHCIYLHGYFGLPPNAYSPRNIGDYQKGQWWQLWFGHPLTRPYLLGVVVAALRGTLTYSHEFWMFDWGWDVLGIDSAWIKRVQWNQVMNKQVAVILIF